MSKFGRAPFYTIVFYVVFCAFITWQEYYTPISANDFQTVLVLRILLFSSALAVGFYIRRNPFSLWANAFICLNFLVYSMVGHFYHPLYYACFMQTLIAFSILFYTTRLQHFVLLTIKTAVFIAFYLVTYDLVNYQPGPETKADYVMTLLVAYGLSLLLHHLFTAERGLKEAANDRFALLGRHASSIVHDIKGSIGIPYLYLQEVKSSLEKNDLSSAKEYLDKMEKNLERIEKTIFDLNQLSRIVERSSQRYRVREALDDVLGLITKRLHEVQVHIDGDFEIQSERGIVSSVFLNLLLNSLESFTRSNASNPKIEVFIKPDSRTITFVDNGGGFSHEALGILKSHRMITSESEGSGLGLYLVAENLRAINGQVSFQNTGDGAKVEIRLP